MINIVLFLLLAFSSSNDVDTSDISTPIDPERTAYVTIYHHTGTSYDNGKIAAARVLVKSMRRTGTKRQFIILVSDNTPSEIVREFAVDGYVVEPVGPVGLLDRCELRFKKIHLWRLKYERIVFVDLDTLVLINMDELFLCGHYCLVYATTLPSGYSTNLMVVKPSEQQYEQLLARYRALKLDEKEVLAPVSCPDEDYKFWLEAFGNMEMAPLFNYTHGQSEEPTNRLLMPYHLNVMLYYEWFSWHLLKQDRWQGLTIPASSLAWHSPTTKPYYWTQAMFFSLHYLWWEAYQNLIEPSYSYFVFTRILMLIFLVAMGLRGLEYMMLESSTCGGTVASVRKDIVPYVHRMIRSIGNDALGAIIGAPLILLSGHLAHALIPSLVPPTLAGPFLFLFYGAILFCFAKTVGLLLCGGEAVVLVSDTETPSGLTAKPVITPSTFIWVALWLIIFYKMLLANLYNDFVTKIIVLFILGSINFLVEINVFRHLLWVIRQSDQGAPKKSILP